MKKLTFLLVGLFGLLSAQIPQGIAFQGIARNAEGQCLGNETLTIGISILESVTPSTGVYEENHPDVQTDAQGIYAITIGQGNTSDTFETVDWSTPKWIGLSINGISVATVELLSVPYAQFANRAATAYSHVFNAELDSSTVRGSWVQGRANLVTPETGTYLILATGKALPNNGWVKFRVFNMTQSLELGEAFIGYEEGSATVNSIQYLEEGDVLTLEYWHRDFGVTSLWWFGGSGSGQTTITIVKIAP